MPKKIIKKRFNRIRTMVRLPKPEMSAIDFKNYPLLQKYLTERGKIFPGRISGLPVAMQRRLTESIKIARFLALLPSGGVKK
jgi:small subunit ribosomal protein S18